MLFREGLLRIGQTRDASLGRLGARRGYDGPHPRKLGKIEQSEIEQCYSEAPSEEGADYGRCGGSWSVQQTLERIRAPWGPRLVDSGQPFIGMSLLDPAVAVVSRSAGRFGTRIAVKEETIDSILAEL